MSNKSKKISAKYKKAKKTVGARPLARASSRAKKSKNASLGKVIRRMKSAVALPTFDKKKKKEPKKLQKTKISSKKEVKVKEKVDKKAAAEQLYILTEEDIRRLSDILARPVIRQSLIDVGGENAIAIIKSFDRAASDDDIAKKLKIKISDVRAALNRLHSEGIVMYNRYKDNETGWYSYSWYLNKDRMEKWADDHARKFEAVSHGNGDEYYVCAFCGASSIISFEGAIAKNFRCDICNKSLEFLDEEKMQKMGLVQARTFVRAIR